jgi:outer membrane immunogenic protein
MKYLIIAAVAAAGLGLAAPAMAQAVAEPTLTQPQGYLNLGYTYLNPYGRDLGEVFGRGGLRFSKWWGVEAEVGGGVMGNHYATGPSINSRVNLSEGIQGAGYAVGYVPLMNGKVDLIGRVGYGQTQLQIRSDVGSSGNNANVNKTVASWNYGAGAQYMVTDKSGLRVDYTRRDFQAKGFDNPHDADTYSVSFVHKF